MRHHHIFMLIAALLKTLVLAFPGHLQPKSIDLGFPSHFLPTKNHPLDLIYLAFLHQDRKLSGEKKMAIDHWPKPLPWAKILKIEKQVTHSCTLKHPKKLLLMARHKIRNYIINIFAGKTDCPQSQFSQGCLQLLFQSQHNLWEWIPRQIYFPSQLSLGCSGSLLSLPIPLRTRTNTSQVTQR